MSRPGSYSVGDYVWCCRCRRVECVGAVFHDEPYHGGNSRLATRAEVAEALVGNAKVHEATGHPLGTCMECQEFHLATVQNAKSMVRDA